MLTNFWSRVIFDIADDTWPAPMKRGARLRSSVSTEPYYRSCIDGAYSYYVSFPQISFYDRLPSHRTRIEWGEGYL